MIEDKDRSGIQARMLMIAKSENVLEFLPRPRSRGDVTKSRSEKVRLTSDLICIIMTKTNN